MKPQIFFYSEEEQVHLFVYVAYVPVRRVCCVCSRPPESCFASHGSLRPSRFPLTNILSDCVPYQCCVFCYELLPRGLQRTPKQKWNALSLWGINTGVGGFLFRTLEGVNVLVCLSLLSGVCRLIYNCLPLSEQPNWRPVWIIDFSVWLRIKTILTCIVCFTQVPLSN